MNDISTTTIKVLLVEDNPGDARLIREMLDEYRSLSFDLVWIECLSTALERLLKGGLVDVILLDLFLPDSQGLETLTKLHSQISDTPIVILTGLDDVKSAIKALRQGAQDYMIKGQIDSNALVRNIRYAIERKRLEDDIRYKAYHDALTDLPNQTLFKDRLALELAHAKRYKYMLSVMFLDLDGFKQVNDTFGHNTGNQLLKELAQRLKSLLREGDTVARFGGDEFVLLLPRINQADEAAEVAQRIIENTKKPYLLYENEVQITVSIGIALYPNDGEDGEMLLSNADMALYQAKNMGKNNYQFYSSIL